MMETTRKEGDAFPTNPILYLDCGSGISGDMFVAALLDLGADAQKLQEKLRSLPLEGYSVRISRVEKSALSVCDFDVILEQPENGLDHDMEYLYGHEHGHEHSHEHNHADANADAHRHAHQHTHTHTHNHIHRTLADVTRILQAGALGPQALSTALSVFTIVAQAEAQVHGKSIDEVHFHEVGAVDSIIDIAAAAICLEDLQIKRVVIPHLTDGTGSVRCQHGILPIPVPAVAQIAASHQLPLHIAPIRGELVTPTGAAIAAAIQTDRHLPHPFTIQRIGMGAGKRVYPETAGFLRAMLITEEA